MTVGHPLGGICAVPTNTAQTDIIVIDCLVNYNVNYSKPSFIYSLPPKEAIARFPSVMTRERRSRQGIPGDLAAENPNAKTGRRPE